MLIIVGFPRDENFFQGLDLILTCNIELDSAVDSPVLVQSTWLRNGIEIDGDSRITTINTTTEIPQSSYQTALRLNPMDINDVGTYNCTVTVMSHYEDGSSFVISTTVSTVRNITDISSEIVNSTYCHYS